MPGAACAGRGAAEITHATVRMARTAFAVRLEGRATPHSSAKATRPLAQSPFRVTRQMRDLLWDLMDSASGHAEYADARHVRSLSESISTRNGALEEVERTEQEGVGVRVRVGGAWGFAATREATPAAAEAALRRAIDVARAQPAAPAAELAPTKPAHGSWRSTAERDPFEVPVEDKA